MRNLDVLLCLATQIIGVHSKQKKVKNQVDASY